ncbi:LytTR family DNA-binding domain-containing protein [Butyrivibrio sp. MC2013]|uniref:LytTR family DNA-binding domain-containing protein n=1 Tax=Butyrivibrio sp. MC2013 TaxID=1280686 RepID=UPI000406B23D|nr:LytTR family DNA-binding domain-containing protein [Butyrivibrio sp. MC2013]
MKIIIETDPSITEPEITIKCKKLDENIMKLQQYLEKDSSRRRVLNLNKSGTSYYVPVKDIYYFESDGPQVYAHSRDRIFEAPFKLYELEGMLGLDFMRVSKSCIINLRLIYSINRNLTSSSSVEFKASNKIAYISRSYYKAVMERLKEIHTS